MGKNKGKIAGSDSQDSKTEIVTDIEPTETKTVETETVETAVDKPDASELQNSKTESGTGIESTETETAEAETVSNELVETANKLMNENNVKTIFRTNDGYWFTKHDMAKQHQNKIGGEVEIFNK